MNMNNKAVPVIKTVAPAHMSIYPTLSNVSEVIDFAGVTFPEINRNAMYGILMTFQNTILKAQHDRH